MVQAIERGSELEQSLITPKAPYKSLFEMNAQEQIEKLIEFSSDNFRFLFNHLPNRGGYPTAFHHDPGDWSFEDTDWLRDAAEIAAVGTSYSFRKVHPEYREAADYFTTEVLGRQYEIFGRDDEWVRFNHRPQRIADNQRMVHDDLAVSTKTHVNGSRVNPWSHNQLDALARFINVSITAIKLGLPILDQKPEQPRAPGEIILKTADYIAPQTEEDIASHGPWEEKHCFVNDSTKITVMEGQSNVDRIFHLLKADAERKGYNLPVEQVVIQKSIHQGTPHKMSHFPYDNTSPFNHPHPADLAQLKLMADITMPLWFQKKVLEQNEELNGEFGYERWIGDDWKMANGQRAQWSFGNGYRAIIDANLAMYYFIKGDLSQANDYLKHGILMMDRLLKMVHEYEYPRELYSPVQDPEDRTWKFIPNENDLGWLRSLICRASTRMVLTLQRASMGVPIVT